MTDDRKNGKYGIDDAGASKLKACYETETNFIVDVPVQHRLIC